MQIKLNLLSEAKKIEVNRKKRYRLIVWQEILGISLVLFYGMILVAIHTMYSLQIKNLEGVNASRSQNSAFREIGSAEKKFQDVNKKTADIMKFQQEHIVWSNFFIALDKAIPDGILLNHILTSNTTISLSGKASTRETLLQFQDKLNTSDCLQNAKIPLANLFTQDNVDFQLDVEIKKDCLKPGNL